MTGKNSKSKKSKSSAKKGGHQQAATHVTPQKENVPDSASTEKSPQRTFQGDENGGLEQVGPSLTSGNVEFGFYGEDPVEQGSSSRPVRLREPNKRIDELEVRVEKAVHAKRQRNWYLGELRKRRNCVQELILSPSTQISGVEAEICSYQNEREMKLQLEILINQWRKKGVGTPPSESGLSHGSDKSERSCVSNRSSVKEKRRVAVEAELEVQTLKEKQELERKLEVERSKAELNRKLELLSAKTKMEQAEIDLLLECGEENEAKDGMNDYLKEHGANYPPAKGHLSQPVAGGATPSSESQPVVDNGKMQTSSAQDIAQTSLSSLVTASYVTSGSAVTTSAPNVGRVAIHKTSSSSLTTLAPSICTKSSTPISYAPRFNLPRATSTAVAASPMSMHRSPGMPTWSCSPRTVGLDASATEFYPANTPQQSASTYIYSAPPFEQQASPQSRMQPDPWVAVAEAIKQGPSLPKVELMKFSGDPLEYVEFVTNFRDNIENQVSDESQRLTRLLAQCSGKAKEAIRSCVNLTVGERYTEAWRTLSENFGQPHMIVEAHMKKLREIQVRKADATTLMEFVRRLEDARRVLTSMGHNYVSRLDNEDVIISLMRKLPDEGLKRKWVDKAGDLIKSSEKVERTLRTLLNLFEELQIV